MHILLLRHYPHVEGPSMHAFANQIAAGLRNRGYLVLELTAPVCFGGLLSRKHVASKWLGYIDQFIIFPPLLWLRAATLPPSYLCVLADQALGPWFPWLAGRSHVVHCHDLLAFEAAHDLQPFHRLGPTGRIYQHWIQHGFRRARCFLSVSEGTRATLERHLPKKPLYSAVLYNPISPRFTLMPTDEATTSVSTALPEIGKAPFLFHIGRNWYKNRLGVLAIWDHLHRLGSPLHLVLVGTLERPLQEWLCQHPHLTRWLHILDNASDQLVLALYNSASALLFPSHAEGFGWPILEAMACGCPVVTTDRAPMTEVAGEAAAYIAAAPPPPTPLEDWALEAARRVQTVLARTPGEQQRFRQLGFAQVRRFQLDSWVDQLESHYQQALALQEFR